MRDNFNAAKLKMQVFNIKSMHVFSVEERVKNVFYSSDKFKVRIIELKPKENIPACEMTADVIFYVVAGVIQMTVKDEIRSVNEGECLISSPGYFSMYSQKGARILGIQII